MSIKYPIIMQIAMIFSWLSFLASADSYYMPYLAVGIIGMLCLCRNLKKGSSFRKDREGITAVLMAAVFSVAVLMANYVLLADSKFTGNQGKMIRIIYVLVIFLGGYFAVRHILLYIYEEVPFFSWELKRCVQNSHIVFLSSMAVISAINLIFLFLAKYPGNLTPDSMWQIKQILSGDYSNHHPYYHTIVIKLFLMAGIEIFGDINEAVALYHVFQILFMAGCFSFAVLTLWQAGFAKMLVILTLAWYTAMPFHIMYSFTMWKDIMFGGMVVLYVTSVFRILKGIGRNSLVSFLTMVVGGMGTCLFRSNGWFAFALSAVCFTVLFWKKGRKLVWLFVGILAVTFLMKHAALSWLGVSQPDTIEALSIPAQQVARVIVDDGKLTDGQLDMLEKVVDVEAVKEKYDPRISDPVKNLVRAKGNQHYLTDNKGEYLKIYINIGLSNPIEYIKAWIDQTRGYWNGGYAYWRWANGVDKNDLGISRVVRSVPAEKVLNKYLWLYSNIAPLQIFMCIGFYVWGIVVLGYICMVRKNREGLFMCIPNLAIIFSLLVATPVYSEFRYAYAVFCCMPVLIFTAFYEGTCDRPISGIPDQDASKGLVKGK